MVEKWRFVMFLLGFSRYSWARKFGMDWGYKNTIACGTRTASPVSDRARQSEASSVIRKPESSVCIGGEKNAMRCLWAHPMGLVRSTGAPSARSGLRRHPRLPGVGSSTHRLYGLPCGETGALGM